jgi:teichoic acid transport system permease protein
MREWRRTLRLANFEYRAQNNGTWLGFLWNFLNPILQIAVYWLVFAIGLNRGAPQNGYSYIIWMIVGIIPWFFINNCLMATAMSFYKYNGIISHMFIPLSIIPVKTVISEFIEHCWNMLVVFIIFFASGYRVTINVLYLLYYAFAAIAFFIGYSLIVSAITVLYLDFQKLLSSFVRLLFFITPIVWTHDNLSPNLKTVLRLNPLGYIIEGYRGSILYGSDLLYNWKYGIYFWIVTLILFLLGCEIHCKFRKKFIDML